MRPRKSGCGVTSHVAARPGSVEAPIAISSAASATVRDEVAAATAELPTTAEPAIRSTAVPVRTPRETASCNAAVAAAAVGNSIADLGIIERRPAAAAPPPIAPRSPISRSIAGCRRALTRRLRITGTAATPIEDRADGSSARGSHRHRWTARQAGKRYRPHSRHLACEAIPEWRTAEAQAAGAACPPRSEGASVARRHDRATAGPASARRDRTDHPGAPAGRAVRRADCRRDTSARSRP